MTPPLTGEAGSVKDTVIVAPCPGRILAGPDTLITAGAPPAPGPPASVVVVAPSPGLAGAPDPPPEAPSEPAPEPLLVLVGMVVVPGPAVVGGVVA